jgi:translocation and assembly module TamB
MRRLIRPLLIALAVCLVVPVLGLVALRLALDSDAGRARLAAIVQSTSGGAVAVEGLAGDPLDRLRVATLRVSDDQGVWLEIGDAELAWSPRALLQRRLVLDELRARRVSMARLPVAPRAAAPPDAASSDAPALPDGFGIVVTALAIARLDIDPALAGAPLDLTLDGAGEWSPARRALRLEARHAARPADRMAVTATLAASQAGDRIEATIEIDQGAEGWIARRLGLADAPALAARGQLTGPADAARLELGVEAGAARLRLDATLDLPARRGVSRVALATAAMRPHPELRWSALRLDGTVEGSLAAPLVRARAHIADLVAGPLASPALDLLSDGRRDGAATRLSVGATLAAPEIAGAPPGLLAAAPLVLALDMALEEGRQRVDRLSLSHALFVATGDGALADGRMRAQLEVEAPALRAPLAALTGIAVDGAATLALNAEGPPAAPVVALDLGLRDLVVTGTPLDALLGPAPRLEATLLPADGRIGVPSLVLSGAALGLEAAGVIDAQGIAADLAVGLTRLAAIDPALDGALAIRARVDGPLAAPSVAARIESAALRHGRFVAEALRASLDVQPAADGARAAVLDLTARLAGRPLALRGRGRQAADGAWSLAIEQGSFAGVEATATARGRDARPDAATLDATARDLAPLGQVVGVALGGTARVSAGIEGEALRFVLDARGLALAGETAALRLEAEGPFDALRTRLALEAPSLRGTARATLAIGAAPRLRLEAAEFAHGVLAMRLREPARVEWRDGLRIERLRLALGDATLTLDGYAGAVASDLRIALARVPVAPFAAFASGVALDGVVDGEARLTGPIADPGGRLRLEASGLRLPGVEAARGLPPATLRLEATRGRGPITLDAEVRLGAAGRLRVAGEVPLGATAPLALRADGRLDLALSDAVLAPAGRRARGDATIALRIGGTRVAPAASGSLQLADASFEDPLLGLRLDRIAGTARIEERGLRDIVLRGRAGGGEIDLSGRADAAPRGGVALDLRLALRRAQLLRSRQADIALDGALALSGRLPDALRLSGEVSVPRAEFRLAEALPPDFPVLAARETGAAPMRRARRVADGAPGIAPALAGVALDLAIAMPDSVFLRGRGLDAQAAGALRVAGTLAAPVLRGEAVLRRGSFDLLSQRLDFTRGVVAFDGGALADPRLDFEARREARGIVAFVRVSGRPSAPSLTLASEPELPADEILARLLFGRSAAELSPLEMAQIAQGVASLFAGGPGGGFVDAVRQRLGLDQLRLSSSREGDGMGVEAGRLLAPGVYLGVRPGRLPSSYEATLQIEVAPRLRVETDLGAAGRAGLTYEVEY